MGVQIFLETFETLAKFTNKKNLRSQGHGCIGIVYCTRWLFVWFFPRFFNVYPKTRNGIRQLILLASMWQALNNRPWPLWGPIKTLQGLSKPRRPYKALQGIVRPCVDSEAPIAPRKALWSLKQPHKALSGLMWQCKVLQSLVRSQGFEELITPYKALQELVRAYKALKNLRGRPFKAI